MEEQGYSYKIATAEKAVCDKLYSMKPRRNQKEIKKLLFDELRIDEEEFNNLNFKVLLQLCDLYRCTNLKLLRKVVEKLNENSNTKNGEEYNPQNVYEKKNAIKEVMQEIILYGLSRAGFFKEAAFYGGTALRIFYGWIDFLKILIFH